MRILELEPFEADLETQPAPCLPAPRDSYLGAPLEIFDSTPFLLLPLLQALRCLVHTFCN